MGYRGIIASGVILVAIGGIASTAQAAIKTQLIDYKQGDTVLEGYLAYDDAIAGKRPGILAVQTWTGVGDFIRGRVEALAKMGYVAFAPDIYGKGVRPKPPKESGETMAIYMKDRPLLRARVRAGYDILKGHALADTSKLAAIGYCFGGTTVLELARSGAELAGTVVFHGELHTPTPDDAKAIRSRVLVLNGADDPYVPAEHILAFQKEMNAGKVDWQLVNYSGTVHSFTDPAAGNNPARGAAYNEKSEKRSWVAMQDFFRELFH
jgi:dienelactone hydrolase